MIDWSKCPEKYRGGLRRYLEDRIPPGSFLLAMLRNDMKTARRVWDRESVHDLSMLEWFLLDTDKHNGSEGLKPHGRRVWSLHLKAWSGSYIDLSVMPRKALKGDK